MLSIGENLASRSDPDPLKSTLMQELDRYNNLIVAVKEELKNVQLGVQGLVVINTELEKVYDALLVAKVPDLGLFAIRL